MSDSIGDHKTVNTMSTKLNTAPGTGCIGGAARMAGKESPGGTKPPKTQGPSPSLNAGKK